MPSEKKIESLYIHFPFCLKLCNFCDFYKREVTEQSSEIFQKEFSEYWSKLNSFLNENQFSMNDLDTVYIGGGTPSLWLHGHEFLQPFLEDKTKNIREFTLEVDPGTLNEKSLKQWSELGVNRLSLGVQSLNKNLLNFLDRSHTLEQTFELLDLVKKNNWVFSADLLLGIPYAQDKRKVTEEVQKLIDYGAIHISTYLLTPPKDYPLKGQLPREQWIADEFLAVDELLTKNGFNHYEVSNYGLAGFESIHNQNYWTHKGVAAIGPSASGFIPKENAEGLRFKWIPGQKIQMTKENLTRDQIQLEKLYMLLRTNNPFSSKDFNSNIDPKKLEVLLNNWTDTDLINALPDDFFQMKAAGFLVLDTLMDQVFSLENPVITVG